MNNNNKICEYDGALLTGEKALYAHNKIHLNEEYNCKFCQKNFKTSKYLADHEKSVHSGDEYKCFECDQVFSKNENLKRHVKGVHLKVKFHCKVCGQDFPRSDTLKRHYRTCKAKNYQETRNEQEMTNFFEDSPGQFQKEFHQFSSKEICHQCSKTFTSKNSLKTHISDVHSANESKICTFCQHVFSSKSNLSKHMKSKHHSDSPNVAQFRAHFIMLRSDSTENTSIKRNLPSPPRPSVQSCSTSPPAVPSLSCDQCEISFS